MRLIELLRQDPVDARTTAAQVVALRRTFENDGRPDWAGRSQEYRDCIYRVYKDARVPSDSVGSLQAQLRYHVGNAVRVVAPLEDLEALGLDPQGPRARAVRARAEGRVPPRKPVLSNANNPLEMAGFALEAVRTLRQMKLRGKQVQPVMDDLHLLLHDVVDAIADYRYQNR